MDARIGDYISNYQETVKNLSKDGQFIQSLAYNSASTKIEDELNSINTALLSSLIYVLDDKGQAVISSDYKENVSLKGNNYTFREYFTEAMKGNEHVMMAVGVTTGIRGIYFSSPIENNGKIIGVMVIKANLDKIDAIICNNSIYTDIISDNDMIFSTANKNWLQDHASVADDLNGKNLLSTNIIKENWRLRMIYANEDLQKTPVLYMFLIISIGTLLL